MKKKIKTTISLILLSPLIFFIYEGIRLEIIYARSMMTPIGIHSDSYSNLINDFYSGSVKFNDAYLIEKKDTLIAFEVGDKSGLIWILSRLNKDAGNVGFVRKERLEECEDGTFKNYSVSKKPIIRISYNNDNTDHGYHYEFIYSSRSKGELCAVNDKKVMKLILDSSLELRNKSNELFYRVECGFETELYIFFQEGSMYCVFFQ